MLRATMTRPGEISFSEQPRPSPGPGTALVRIRRIGICGSDLHVFHGRHPYTSYPVIQGHEFSGTVEELGEGVLGLAPGDLVTAPPQMVCGTCWQCRHGREHICENLRVIGFQAPGVAQEYFVFHASQLIRLPKGFTAELGALVEPVSVAVHAVRRFGDIEGAHVVVLGAGPIGNLVAQVARWRGAAGIMITDIRDSRLDIARRCGIPYTINTSREDLGTRLQYGFGPARADVIFECVGAQQTATEAVQHARKGSTIVVVGVFSEPPRIDLGLVQDRELSLVGTLMYQRRDYEDAIRCLAEGGIVADPLFTGSFPFRKFLQAYEYIEANRDQVMKVMIRVDDLSESATMPAGSRAS